MGAHLQVAFFFKAEEKKENEAWRWLKPLEVEQIAAAWGDTRVTRRAKKRVRQLHTQQFQAGGKESRGPLLGRSPEGFGGGSCSGGEGAFVACLWSSYFGKVMTAPEASTIGSTHWEVWKIPGELKSPFLSMFWTSWVSEPVLVTPSVVGYSPAPGPVWPPLT